MNVSKWRYRLGQCVTSQTGDRGYAMPVAIGFGLAILLITAAMLLRSHNDATVAVLQEATGSSTNVAESGVTRIQSFVNTNRPIATYNLSDWMNARSRITTLSQCGPVSADEIAAFATAAQTWQNVDPADPSKGQFRLVNYTYAPSNPSRPNEAPGIGTLEVEGRLTNTSSSSRLRVTIPVEEGTLVGVPIPGLWVAEGGTNNNQIEANTLINDCRVPLNSIRTTGFDPNTGDPYAAYYTTLRFPDLPTRPSPILNSLPSRVSSNLTLPRMSDRPATRQLNNGQTVQVYEYSINNLQIAQNSVLTITPGQRVTFYLNGSIQRGGDIQHDCSRAPANVNCNPTNFQIFGYGGTTESICTNGIGYIDAFILAPNYRIGVAGSGGGRGGIRGAAWTREWSTSAGCGSNTANITVAQNATWDLVGLSPRNLPPVLAPISTWQRREVTP